MKTPSYKYYAFTLLFIMVINICRYQIPFIQYYLFKNYIAKNLCVKKDIANNCCHGKCFLEKQLKVASETNPDNEHNKPAQNQKKNISNEENNEFLNSHSHISITPIDETKLQLVNRDATTLQGYASAIYVPPKTIDFIVIQHYVIN